MGTHPYATLAYARTLAHVGRPLFVPSWQTHVVARDWTESAVDAVGTYPLVCLAPACDLGAGLAQLARAGMVSVTGVADPLLGPTADELQRGFSFVKAFKTHYLADPGAGSYSPSAHHRYEIRRAARSGVDVRIVPLQDALDDWTALYDALIDRHGITATQRFSRASFDALARCDGIVATAAYVNDAMVSCHLWIRHGDCVWSHLAASNPQGYACAAAYAIYDHAIRHFAGSIVNLGGAAGNEAAQDDGLTRMKQGFSNRSRTAYLVGSVLDAARYDALCVANAAAANSDYFPAYRALRAAG